MSRTPDPKAGGEDRRRLLTWGIAAARGTWSLDSELSDVPLKARPLAVRRGRIHGLRHLFQAAMALLVLWIGVAFVTWVRGLETGRGVGVRPPGVEGFLPISALMSLRHLLLTGEVHPVHPAGLAILLGVLLTGVLLKKSFCSWLCPVGTLSEMLATLGLKTFGRRLRVPRLLDIPLRGIKYLLLAFFVDIIFLAMSPGELRAFLDSPYNRVADIKMLYFFERLSPVGATVLAVLAGASFLVPYFWCRYLCPYGALLGLASLLSPLKIARHAPSCIDCGLCARACPAGLPVDRLKRVRSDECSACLSCVAACPVSRALQVEASLPRPRVVRPAVFALLVFAFFSLAILGSRALGHWRNAISDTEYAARVHEIDGPEYEHTAASSAEPVGEAEARRP